MQTTISTENDTIISVTLKLTEEEMLEVFEAIVKHSWIFDEIRAEAHKDWITGKQKIKPDFDYMKRRENAIKKAENKIFKEYMKYISKR